MYCLNSPQKRVAINITVITETILNIFINYVLKAPVIVLSLNESSVEGLISNFFKIFPNEPISGKLWEMEMIHNCLKCYFSNFPNINQSKILEINKKRNKHCWCIR